MKVNSQRFLNQNSYSKEVFPLYEKPQPKNPNQHIFNIQYKQDLLLAIQFRRLDSSSQFFTNSRTAKIRLIRHSDYFHQSQVFFYHISKLEKHSERADLCQDSLHYPQMTLSKMIKNPFKHSWIQMVIQITFTVCSLYPETFVKIH